MLRMPSRYKNVMEQMKKTPYMSVEDLKIYLQNNRDNLPGERHDSASWAKLLLVMI